MKTRARISASPRVARQFKHFHVTPEGARDKRKLFAETIALDAN